MLDLNEVLVSGRLAKQIELKNFNKPDGSVGAVLKNTLAISGRTKDAPATFIDFEVWNKQAEIISQYCQKGSPLILKGELKAESWSDKQTGEKRTKIMLKASDFKLIFSNNQNGNNQAQNVDNLAYPVNKQPSARNGFDDLPPNSDEIPF